MAFMGKESGLSQGLGFGGAVGCFRGRQDAWARVVRDVAGTESWSQRRKV